MAIADRDVAKYWTTPLLPSGEFLTATFRTQRFSRHWHDTYVVAVVLDGAQEYWYRGAQRTSRTGMFDIINPGEVHTGEAATDSGWAYRAFYVPVDWMLRLATTLAGAPATRPWFPDDPISDPNVARQLVAAHVLAERGGDALRSETALHSAFARLLTRHAKAGRPAKRIPGDAARVRQMQQRLAADVVEPVTLSALAASVELSPFHAARLFTKVAGMPPHAWRNQLRIHRAAQALRSGAAVADAAAAAGFFDQSHFTRHFKRAYGIPPGTLARTLRS